MASSQNLSAEEKNSYMNQERVVLKNLIQAASVGDFPSVQSVVQQYLQQHIDLSIIDIISQFKDANKRTALHFACQSKTTTSTTSTSDTNNEKDIVEQMLHWLCDDITNNTGKQQLHKLQKLIRMKDSEGLTPLMIIVQYTKHYTILQRRIEMMFKTDLLCSANSTNSASGSANTCTSLGLARSKTGATALHYACSNPYIRMSSLRQIIGSGRVAIRTFSLSGGTPLHYAISAIHQLLSKSDYISLQLNNGADDMADKFYSISNNDSNSIYIGTIETLIQYGEADINATNETIPPPLIVAMATGNDTLSHYILQYHNQKKSSLNTDSQCNDVISMYYLQPSIEYILQPGNVTPLHMAADINLPNTLSLLLTTTQEIYKNKNTGKIGALLDRRNNDGYTALDLAAKEKHVDCVRLLLSALNNTQLTKNDVCTIEDANEYIQKWSNQSAKEYLDKSKLNASDIDAPHIPFDKAVIQKQLENSNDDDPIETKARQDASQIIAQKGIDSDKDDEQNKQSVDKAKEHKEKGNTYFSQKNWEMAIMEYTNAIELQPHNATYYSNRSACYMSMEKYSDALYDGIVAQTLDPEWSKAYYRVAVARLALHRYEDAAVAAFEGLQKEPENGELQALCRKCVKRGRKDYHSNNQK